HFKKHWGSAPEVWAEEGPVSLRWVFLFITCALGAETATDPRIHDAQQFIRKGQFLEAAKVFRDVYDDAKKNGSDDARISEAAAELAGAYIFLDRYAESEPLLRESIEIDQRLSGGLSPDA